MKNQLEFTATSFIGFSPKTHSLFIALETRCEFQEREACRDCSIEPRWLASVHYHRIADVVAARLIWTSVTARLGPHSPPVTDSQTLTPIVASFLQREVLDEANDAIRVHLEQLMAVLDEYPRFVRARGHSLESNVLSALMLVFV